MTMVITALLLHVVATERWNWPLPVALAVTGAVPHRSTSRSSAPTSLKIPHGGWFPLVIGAVHLHADDDLEDRPAARGRAADRARACRSSDFLAGVDARTAGARAGHRGLHDRAAARHAAGAAAQPAHNKVLHEHVVILTVTTAHDAARAAGRARRRSSRSGTASTTSRCSTASWRTRRARGARCARASTGSTIDVDDVTYFLGRETIIVTTAPGMAIWREKLFVLMARNAVRATAFFRLPPDRVVELGVQVEI